MVIALKLILHPFSKLSIPKKKHDLSPDLSVNTILQTRRGEVAHQSQKYYHWPSKNGSSDDKHI